MVSARMCIECNGGEQVPMKNAIVHLHEEPIFLRVLGSYEI